MLALVLWFIGLVGLIVAAAVASGRGRASPNEVASRGVIATAAIAYAAVVASAMWLWGGATARDGRLDRLREGVSVSVEIESVRVPFERSLSIGHRADAGVRIPGAGADELARVELDGQGTATVRASAGAVVVGLAAGERVATVARSARCGATSADYVLPAGAAVVIVECRGDKPVRGLVVRRDRGAVLLVTPLALLHGRLAEEQRVLRAGDALRLGGAGDALPGLVTWDVASPNGAAAMLAIPADPTECAAWSTDGTGRVVGAGCSVTAGAFSLVAKPFVPDDDGVLARGIAVAMLVGIPPLLLLVVLMGSPRRARQARALGRALRLAVLGGGMTALACWRLLWAHRIDMASETGTRVAANELATVALGAAFAGAAVLALDALEGRSLIRRCTAALIAWTGWLVFGGFLTGVSPAMNATTAGVLALSLAVAFVPVWSELAGRYGRRIPAELVLAMIAVIAIASRLNGWRGALGKLGLAYATVLAGHAALRAMLVIDTTWMRRARLAVTIVAAAGSVAMLDAGVTLAIVGVGLALAMLVAGHDAMYDASHAGKIGLLEREHARLLVVHGAATIALAIGVACCAALASDRALIEYGALFVLHAPLVAAGLFGLAALVARSHRRAWAPWVAAALAALAAWGLRDAMLERATAGDGVASRRVSAVVEPGYALLRDDHAFVANASAWREAALATTSDVDVWRGQGYFGARVRDPGVLHSIDNDYLPVLVAREAGVGGLMQGVMLLLALVIGGGAIASVRLRHASREHRARWLVTAVAGTLAVYQPLASLGVLPLTGISWPGLGIDSPADLWLFALGAMWLAMGGDGAADDERVRRTPRLARARRVVLVALTVVGVTAVVVVVRAGACALVRAAEDDQRVVAALRYATTLSCAAPEVGGADADAVIPLLVAGKPTDAGTLRFERELQSLWQSQRAALVGAFVERPVAAAVDSPGDPNLTFAVADPIAPPIIYVGEPAQTRRKKQKKVDDSKRDRKPKVAAKADDPDDDPTSSLDRVLAVFGLQAPAPEAAAPLPCPARAGAWRLVRDGNACVAKLEAGWPELQVAVNRGADGVHARCSVLLPDDAVSSLRTTVRAPRQRIRVVSAPLGASAEDVGEVTVGDRVIRMRATAPDRELAALAGGPHAARKLAIGEVSLEVRTAPRGVVLRGPAELFIAEAGDPAQPATWRRSIHAEEVVLDRVTLVVAGSPDRRVVALFRPPRAWAGAAPVVDALLADTAGDRVHRIYPYGSALPELGWVNPYDVDRSLGLDGWIHAARTHMNDRAPACGTLAPPVIDRDRVCTPSPLDGVLECRVALQPELALALRGLAAKLLESPKQFTGRETQPVRVAYVALRGDTGELLAQGNLVPGRPALAYAPGDAEAEAALVKLRNQPGEADSERVEWNLPIAVGSTFKPIVARAAEQAFPQITSTMSLTAAGHATGCRRRRGNAVDPILGHCPPTSVAGQPTTADLHEFLARSPNWFQAVLGILGLGLPDGKLSVKDADVTFAAIAGSDLASWPADSPLVISDATGPILGRRGIAIDGLRRTPMWSRVEALLGRPTCTLGDRASCERAALRADVCAARGLPIASPGPDLRNLVALGPDRIDLYAGDRAKQASVPVREYLQLLRGSGVHAVGSLPQITDAFGRVIYDPSTGAPKLAASWFPAPATGVMPSWSCTVATGRANTVLGADGGLCGVVQPGGTAYAALKELLADPSVVIYGAKTGTIDSLADIARSPSACRRWNESHVAAARLECGRAPPDDSLFVIAFGVHTAKGTIPITLGIQLQRAGKTSASKATAAFVRAIAGYLRGT
ncbi:MAG: hypothetical protein ABI867_17075 [Kofleriaceae bacterium]